MALLIGWIISGTAFYFSLTNSRERDESHFQSQVASSKLAVESRMEDYIQLLESGVSLFNASEYVSKDEWQIYASKLLSTKRYPGIEGFGVIFPQSLVKRLSKNETFLLRYQPEAHFHQIPNVLESNVVRSPDDNFIVSYIEPFEINKKTVGLNLSSEKNRYEAAIAARDSGLPKMSNEVQLTLDTDKKTGFLLFVPIYRNGLKTDTVENRRFAFLGLVCTAVVFEKFIKSAIPLYPKDISLKIIDGQNEARQLFPSQDQKPTGKGKIVSEIFLAGKAFKFEWQRGPEFESSTSLVSSWVGFFGALASLFLVVLLSSLQNLKMRAQEIAAEITEELKIQKNNWKVLTENSPVGIFLTDSAGLCTYVNPTWTKMTGLLSQDAYGNGWSRALHPEDVEIVVKNWGQLVESGSFSCNYRYLRMDGKIVYVAGQALPLVDSNNHITGYFGTIQDITELHLNQIAVADASRMSSLGQMASSIAHEINNPLTVIQGRASYLEKVYDEQIAFDKVKVKNSISQIVATVQRIVKIIKGLQMLSRNGSGEPFVNVPVKDLVCDILDLCSERFANNQTKLITPNSYEMNASFLGRPEQISQVFVNLLNNAFDAAQAVKEKWVKIEISVDNSKNNILVSFTDSGLGVSKLNQEKIFDPFFTTKDIGNGTGLGLSISKSIVSKHGGRLVLDKSKVDTTFVVELPLNSNSSIEGQI